MTKLFLLVFLLMSPVALAGGGVGTSQAPAHNSESANRLERLLEPLQSMKADFSQVVVDVEGFELQAMEGTLVVARPGKIFWQTRPPFEQLLVSDAETLWLYDQDLEQVTVRPFDNDIAKTPAVLLIGKVKNLEEKYAVSGQVNGEISRFTLVPKDQAALYSQVTVMFDGDTPTAMVLGDSLGQETRITFTNVSINFAVSDNQFHFAIPEGVDVLYE